MRAPFLPFDFLIDFLEVQFVVIRVREGTPDINDSPFIVHPNDESVIILANIKYNELTPDRARASVRVPDVQRSRPFGTPDDLIPRIQRRFGVGMPTPKVPKLGLDFPWIITNGME
jgi:hypothetical protein